jgi:putative peptidoglycan lipid II flippase
MWPRTLSLLVFQLGVILTLSLISFIPPSGRNYVIFDYAQTIFFAPIALFGQTVATAALPILSREREQASYFRSTFLTSYNQVLYLVLPVSVLILVLRIPIVRLIFGAGQFDWQATVLTGRTLAFFALSIFAQALIALISKAFYALQDTKTPLAIGGFSTILTIILSVIFIFFWNNHVVDYYVMNRFRLIPRGVEAIPLAYTIGGVVNLVLLLIYLNKKIGGIFSKEDFIVPQVKIFIASFFTAIAIYVPIKLLDQLVFDTTKTINLILLGGISSLAGGIIYLFLTWLFNVKEATTFLLIFRRLGNWKEILQKANEL